MRQLECQPTSYKLLLFVVVVTNERPNHLSQKVGKNIGVYVQNIFTVVVALIIAFIAGWELTLVMVAMLPLLILGNIIETRTYMTSAKAASAEEARAGQVSSLSEMQMQMQMQISLSLSVSVCDCDCDWLHGMK